jgi:anti-sigma B factor antagonist
MRGELTVHVESKGDRAAQVVLEGSVDAHTVERFQKALADLAEGGVLWLVVDLSKMEYISSVGLNVLVNARSERRKAGGDLLLVAPQSHVLTIFKMLGLLEVLPISPTLDAAWTSLGRAPARATRRKKNT